MVELISLIQRQRQAISRIRKSGTKRIGLIEVELSVDDKREMIQRVQRLFKQQFENIYTDIFERGNTTMSFEKRITDLIQVYGVTTDTVNEGSKAVIDHWKDFMIQYKADPLTLTETVKKEINDIREEAAKTAAACNKSLKSIVKDMKQQFLPATGNKPADYAARVSNALQFLNLQGDSLTDETAFLILKDFVNDPDQMRLFKNVIERQTDFNDANGSRFSKTFEKLNNVEIILNTLNEVELIAENLFLHPKLEGESYRFGDTFFVLTREDYDKELEGEANILKLVKDLEAMAVDMVA